MLIKGEGLGGNDSADHIVGGAEWSTLSHDAFPGQEFDFMVANPPYGKSWKKDLEALGSRIAEVHNGSSLFTGDAGQGESNIRRWLIENDWVEALVALPLNLFYNTGIATYVWVLSNRKPVHRRGQVQLIDASQWFKPLRKNLGKKNCELAPDDIERISRTFLDFKETPESKIFSNAAFGCWKVTVERPLRLHSQLSLKATRTLRFASGDEEMRAALFEDHNVFRDRVDAVLKKAGTKLPAAELKLILKAVSWRVETAPPVIAKVHKPGKLTADPMLGRYDAVVAGKPCVVEYEPDADLRDTEQVPLLEERGVEAFIRREVLPYTPDAWINNDATNIGYEVSFTRHFYKPQPLRTLAEISADILVIEKEAEGLLDGLLVTKAEA